MREEDHKILEMERSRKEPMGMATSLLADQNPQKNVAPNLIDYDDDGHSHTNFDRWLQNHFLASSVLILFCR